MARGVGALLSLVLQGKHTHKQYVAATFLTHLEVMKGKGRKSKGAGLARKAKGLLSERRGSPAGQAW